MKQLPGRIAQVEEGLSLEGIDDENGVAHGCLTSMSLKRISNSLPGWI